MWAIILPSLRIEAHVCSPYYQRGYSGIMQRFIGTDEYLKSLTFVGSKLAIGAAIVIEPILCNTVASMIASLDVSQGKLPSDETLEFFILV